MNATSTTLLTGADEFDHAGVDALPLRLVHPDRAAHSPATFECRETQIMRLETKEGRTLDRWLVIGEASVST